MAGAEFGVTIRDLSLVRKLMREPTPASKVNGRINVRVPGAAKGGADLIVQWAIHSEAYDQYGHTPAKRGGPDKEAA